MTDAAARRSLGLGLDARLPVVRTEADTDADLYRELVRADAEAVRWALHEFAPD